MTLNNGQEATQLASTEQRGKAGDCDSVDSDKNQDEPAEEMKCDLHE